MKYIFQAILLCSIVVVGCNKIVPSDSQQQTVVTLVDSARALEISQLPNEVKVDVKLLPAFVPEPLTDTAMARPMPDFTDAGVGMLLWNAEHQDPTIISSCIVPALQTWFTSLGSAAGPLPLMLPNPSTPSTSCSTGEMVEWRFSPNQLCAWQNTSTMVRTQFLNALRAYQNEVATQGYFFPGNVVYLNYGSSICQLYRGVQIQRLTDAATAKIVEFRIVLIVM